MNDPAWRQQSVYDDGRDGIADADEILDTVLCEQCGKIESLPDYHLCFVCYSDEFEALPDGPAVLLLAPLAFVFMLLAMAASASFGGG